MIGIRRSWNWWPRVEGTLQEVDRVIEHTELNEPRLIPLLRGAMANFELVLEIDNINTHVRYWRGRMHFEYHVHGLVNSANLSDADAPYELGCQLRIELHPRALYLPGAVYLTGDCVKKDVATAMRCFHKASEKGHTGVAIAFGSMKLGGVKVPYAITRFDASTSPTGGARKKQKANNVREDPMNLAKEQFQIGAEAGCDLGFLVVEKDRRYREV